MLSYKRHVFRSFWDASILDIADDVEVFEKMSTKNLVFYKHLFFSFFFFQEKPILIIKLTEDCIYLLQGHLSLLVTELSGKAANRSVSSQRSFHLLLL